MLHLVVYTTRLALAKKAGMKAHSARDRLLSYWTCNAKKDCSWTKLSVLTPLDAMQAGLDIQTLERWHFGTTYYIVARPPHRLDPA